MKTTGKEAVLEGATVAKREEEGIEVGKSPYRYVIIGLYLYYLIIVGMSNNPLTPISSTTMRVYEVTGDKVALTTSICQIANIIASFPSIAFANRAGVRWTIMLGTLLLAVGMTTRHLINENFLYVPLGQLFAGAAGPFLNAVQANVITGWFNKQQRGIWLALTSLGSPLGVMFGFVIPLFFMSSSDSIDNATQKSNMRLYLLFEGGLAIAALVTAVVLFKAAPPALINETQSIDDIKNRETFILPDPEEGTMEGLL